MFDWHHGAWPLDIFMYILLYTSKYIMILTLNEFLGLTAMSSRHHLRVWPLRMKLPEMEATFFSHVFITFVGRTAHGQSLFSDKGWQTSTRERKRYSGAWFSSTILDVVAPALSTAVAPFAEATNGGAKPLVPERNVILEYLRSNEMRGTGQLRLRASRESCYEAVHIVK